MSERDELAEVIHAAQWIDGKKFRRNDSEMAGAILAAGYRLIDHTEYALDHKLADIQFTDDDGNLWDDEDDVKDYASEYGDTAPLVKRHVTEWEPAS